MSLFLQRFVNSYFISRFSEFRNDRSFTFGVGFYPLKINCKLMFLFFFQVIESGLKAIVNNFVTERNSNEVMAVG